MITINDAAVYMGIDYFDDLVTANLQRAVSAATYRLYGSVGRDVELYLPDDPRIHDLLCIYAEESYDGHVGSVKQDAVQERLKKDYELQLRLELREKKAKAGGEPSGL